MVHPFALDVVIPSYRLQEGFLLPLLELKAPPHWQVNWFIVCDNPALPIPQSLLQLNQTASVTIIKNTGQHGPSAARNLGISAGKAPWVLMLDDDIKADPELLKTYTSAIEANPDSIGFVGPTWFPAPTTAASKALVINGSVGHFAKAETAPEMAWAPSANVVMNREKMHPDLFDVSLNISGEDIEFMVRNCNTFGQQYLSVPHAKVEHPWWNEGRQQTQRMYRYGKGSSTLTRKNATKAYAYFDFTNTPETLLLLVIALPFALAGGFQKWIFAFAAIMLIAEFITNWAKAIVLGNTFSPVVAWQCMVHKLSYETGALAETISSGSLRGFTKRMEMGFAKPNPSHYRTNRWKTIKLAIITVLMLAAYVKLR